MTLFARPYTVHTLDFTTDAGGDATVDTNNLTGELLGVEVDGTALSGTTTFDLESVVAALTDGADDLVEKLIDAADVSQTTITRFYPRVPADDITGTEEDVNDNETGAQKQLIPFPLFGHVLRVTVAGGGNTLAGRARLLIVG
jgi:hypothetical protein